MVCLRNISVDTLHKGDTGDNNNTYLGIHVRVRYFCPILPKFRFSPTDFHKSPPTSNIPKIRPVGAEQIHVARQRDTQTNMTKLIVAIRQYANDPKNET
jgi:hypothetical protein